MHLLDPALGSAELLLGVGFSLGLVQNLRSRLQEAPPLLLHLTHGLLDLLLLDLLQGLLLTQTLSVSPQVFYSVLALLLGAQDSLCKPEENK